MTSFLLETAKALLETPTAPFREEWMCETLDSILATIPGIEVDTDNFGNRIVRLRRGAAPAAKAVYVAHLDHPGFVIEHVAPANGTDSANVTALFEGRVFDPFFSGAAVRLYRSKDDTGVAGRILSATETRTETDNRFVEITTTENAGNAVLGMWDVTPFALEDGIIHGRACDDLLGCAAILEALRRLAHSEEAVDVAAVFTRAEEAGFCGIIGMLSENELPPLLPSDPVFISVEISGETAQAPLSGGAIIRVGDRASSFDPHTCDLLYSLSRFQEIEAHRALMDRGTCEATPINRAGYRAGAVCAPVRHYHNMDQERGVIVSEQVAVADLDALASLIAGLAPALSAGEQPKPLVDHNFALFLNKARRLLVPLPLAPKLRERAGTQAAK